MKSYIHVQLIELTRKGINYSHYNEKFEMLPKKRPHWKPLKTHVNEFIVLQN